MLFGIVAELEEELPAKGSFAKKSIVVFNSFVLLVSRKTEEGVELARRHNLLRICATLLQQNFQLSYTFLYNARRVGLTATTFLGLTGLAIPAPRYALLQFHFFMTFRKGRLRVVFVQVMSDHFLRKETNIRSKRRRRVL